MDNNILKGNLFSLANVDAQKVLNSLEDDELELNPTDVEIGRKRKRLDDFTPQEKMVRRKLKNRVAAQNARDRKKERLEQLEIVVGRLEKENKELKKSNNELRSNMSLLMSQNKTMREKLGMTEIEFQVPKSFQSTPIITPTVRDHDHIVIKKEEQSETEYASLRISLQQKLQVLLVSLVTMWLANPRLENCLLSLNESEQEVVVKYLLQKKLIVQKMNSKENNNNNSSSMPASKTTKLIQLLLQMDLVPIIQSCLVKTQNFFPSVKKFKTSWMDPAIC